MTALPKPSLLSPHDLTRLEDEAGVEYVNGQIVGKPVSVESSEIELTIGALLRAEAAKSRSARVFPASMGYRCFADDPSRFRKPDVSVVTIERMAAVASGTGLMPIPPDLAVEVLSPTDYADDVAAKVEEYLSNGFPLVWIVQPKTRTVVIYHPDGSAKVLHEKDEITGGAALPTFRCKVAEFFAKPA